MSPAAAREAAERAKADADRRVRDAESRLADALGEAEAAREAEKGAVARAEQVGAALSRLDEKIPQLSEDRSGRPIHFR